MYSRCRFYLPSPPLSVGWQLNYNPYFFTSAICLFFHLNYIFLFCCRDLSTFCPFDPIIQVIQDATHSWYLSQYEFILNKFGDSIRYYQSCLYLSPIPLPNPSIFFPSLPPSFPSTSPWISPIFNSPSFSLLTTKFDIPYTTLLLLAHRLIR